MTEEARARIEAIERHTELGSGFKVASLDLELRGAGDLLGVERLDREIHHRGRVAGTLQKRRRPRH